MKLYVQKRMSKAGHQYFALCGEYKSGKSYTYSVDRQFISTICYLTNTNLCNMQVGDFVYITKNKEGGNVC